MKTKLQILVSASFLLSMMAWPFATQAAEEPSEPSCLHASPERMNEWRDLKFGMFIHWGPVSLKGTEIGWSRGGERRGRGGTGTIPVEIYDNLYKEFNPVQFDPDEWVRIAKSAGMRYMVFTSRHHDGFSMFDSKYSDYKITNPASPYKKDIVKQLTDAAHRANFPVGLYYSQPDWHNADYRTENHQRYLTYMHGQVEELCTNYGKIDILWFDGLGGSAKDWDAENLFRKIRKLQPDIVINNRCGLPADLDTPEQRVGGFQNDRPWETCMTICRQWAWKPDDRMKSLEECLGVLIRTVGGDGNLLFNVGPMPDGRIEPRQVERLHEMGQWVKTNSQALFGVRGGPFLPGKWGASTHNQDHVYLMVADRQGKETLLLPPTEAKIRKANLLGGKEVLMQETLDGVLITIPAPQEESLVTVIDLTLDRPASEIPPTPMPAERSASVAFGKKAQASNIYRNMSTYAPAKAFDDDPETRWATDSGTSQTWISVDLGQAQTISRVLIDEDYGQRIQQFQIEKKTAAGWEILHAGTTLGPDAEVVFPPATGQVFRLVILKATDGPTIKEFQMFEPDKKK